MWSICIVLPSARHINLVSSRMRSRRAGAQRTSSSDSTSSLLSENSLQIDSWTFIGFIWLVSLWKKVLFGCRFCGSDNLYRIHHCSPLFVVQRQDGFKTPPREREPGAELRSPSGASISGGRSDGSDGELEAGRRTRGSDTSSVA